MIGLDTNILIRYLMKDDLKQFEAVEKLIDRAFKDHNLLYINLTVLCEVVWVLSYHYELNREEISKFLEMLLHSDHLEIENRPIALVTFHDYQTSQADFADCLIGNLNHNFGCTTTYTFDKKAGKLSLFTHLT